MSQVLRQVFVGFFFLFLEDSTFRYCLSDVDHVYGLFLILFSTYPSIHFLYPLNPNQESWEGLEPFPAAIGQEAEMMYGPSQCHTETKST